MAAESKLRQLNSQIKIDGVVSDLTSHNVEELLNGFDLILDGTDNFETRFLLNDYAVHASPAVDLCSSGGQLWLDVHHSPGNHRMPGMPAGNSRCR